MPAMIKSIDSLFKKMPTKGIVCEIGIYKGKFSQKIQKISRPKEHHMIDCWAPLCDPSGEVVISQKEQDKFFRFVSTSFKKLVKKKKCIIYKEYSRKIVSKFPDFFFDWVFVDGSHKYEDALEDLTLYYPKVKMNGFICGHDYLNKTGKQLGPFGVIEAVTKFLSKNLNLKLDYLTSEKSPSYGIRKIK